MIATRKRHAHFSPMKYLKILLFAVVVYELYSVPASHAVIFDGPLKPFWKQVADAEKKFVQPYLAPVLAPMIKPLHFAALERQLYERAHTLEVLKAKLASKEAELKDKDAAMKATTKRMTQMQHTTPVAKQNGASVGGVGTLANPALSPSPDDAKTAAYWSSMEAENAAQIAQKLAPIETARIFLAMKPDQVAEIMNLLPTAYNVKLKEVHLLGGSAQL